MRTLVVATLVILLFPPAKAGACSGSAAGGSFVRPTTDGFVFVPLPREDFVVVVRGQEQRRVPIESMGMYGAVSPDGRWFATWVMDYSDELLAGSCMATGGRLLVYDLRQRRPVPQRLPWIWARSNGLEATGLRFSTSGQFIRMGVYAPAAPIYSDAEDTSPTPARYAWYSLSGNRFRPTSESDVELQAPTLRRNIARPPSGELARHHSGLRATIENGTLIVDAMDGANASRLRIPARDVEDAEFSTSGDMVIITFASRSADPYNSYATRGFAAIRVDNGTVATRWGTHPPLAIEGSVPLRCGVVANDSHSPLAVRTAPRSGARRVGQLVLGTPVRVVRRRGSWTEIEAPSGWVFGRHLARGCRPIAPEPASTTR